MVRSRSRVSSGRSRLGPSGNCFAAIAGTKTLGRSDLANIKSLGFVVEEVATKKLAA